MARPESAKGVVAGIVKGCRRPLRGRSCVAVLVVGSFALSPRSVPRRPARFLGVPRNDRLLILSKGPITQDFGPIGVRDASDKIIFCDVAIPGTFGVRCLVLQQDFAAARTTICELATLDNRNALWRPHENLAVELEAVSKLHCHPDGGSATEGSTLVRARFFAPLRFAQNDTGFETASNISSGCNTRVSS